MRKIKRFIHLAQARFNLWRWFEHESANFKGINFAECLVNFKDAEKIFNIASQDGRTEDAAYQRGKMDVYHDIMEKKKR